jgi:GT2 family glycosyltransferase
LDVIVDAVGRLATRNDLRFTFIGTGEERARIEPIVRATRADVEFVNWVEYGQLGKRIAAADVVLGVFGGSAKARMVIPNKVYEAAAMGCAVLTADTPAIREIFTDGRDVATCVPDGAALADAIARLADDPGLRRRLGTNAAALMAERFSDTQLGRAWGALLDADQRAGDAQPLVGVAILNFNDADSTVRCLASLAHSHHHNLRVLVIDNGSRAEERRRLEQKMAGRFHASIRWLDENLGYARANNLAVESLFEQGCEYVLVLNDDTIVTPDAIDGLVRCARRHPGGGPVGPRVARDWPGTPAASLGERYSAALLWAPRTLLRYRRVRQSCYAVGGIMGCAMLFSRSTWDRLGGFDERLFAYYEEVDLCLRARRAGLVVRVEPAAEIAHVGHRGFAAGFTPTAAYLKTRNLWLVAKRALGPFGLLVFVPGYLALLATSMALYLLRGRRDVVRAMSQGAAAAWRGEQGPPPDWVFAGAAGARRVGHQASA